MLRLKADMHMHTSEDPFDTFIPYSVFDLLDRAAELGFEVISVTCHELDISTEEIVEYAAAKNILYIGGLETAVFGKHVLIYGAGQAGHWVRNFDDVRELKENGALVVAPHPFFPANSAVGPLLDEFGECFDALEHTSFYHGLMNFNTKAADEAKKMQLPLLGSSDMHHSWQFNQTHSYLHVKEKSVEAVFEAIRKGSIEIVSKPFKFNRHFVQMALDGAGLPKFIIKNIAPAPIGWT